MDHDLSTEQHSVRKSLLLHFSPGVLIGLCYWALLQPFRQWGYPSIMALTVAAALILVPVELGYLLYQGNKKNGRLSLEGIVSYRAPIPVRDYFVWVPALFVIAGIIFTLMKPIDGFLQHSLFAWMPVLETGLQGEFSRGALIVTYAMVTVFVVVLGPAVEEFYFRGYLLPRMGYAGKWAPLLHSLLFALYHVFTPWMFVTRTIGMLPLVYAVRRRNLYVGIITHILLNMVDVVVAASFIISMA